MSPSIGMQSLLNNHHGHDTLARIGTEIDQKWLPFIQEHVATTQHERKKQQEILQKIQVDAARGKAASIVELIRLTASVILKDQKHHHTRMTSCINTSLEAMKRMYEESKRTMEALANHIMHKATVEANRIYLALTHMDARTITSYPVIAHPIARSDNIQGMREKNKEFLEYDRMFLEDMATDIMHASVPDYNDVQQQYNQTREQLERVRNTHAFNQAKLQRIRKTIQTFHADMRKLEREQQQDESHHQETHVTLQAETNSMIRAAHNAQSKTRSIENASNERLKAISYESSRVLDALEVFVQKAERLASI